MLTIILADAELEIVPEELWNHPSVIKNAKRRKKKPSEILLDVSLHQHAIEDPEEAKRRGRPDIVYVVMTLCLDSIANAEGNLTILVHTRNDELIEISPKTRSPKSYNRFVGLVEDLFEKGAVPEGKPLLTLARNMTLKDVLRKVKAKTTICLAPDGEMTELTSLFQQSEEPIACIVGGFPNGDYKSPARELSDRIVSISPYLLKVWTVASNILVNYQESKKTYKQPLQ